ncbi:MAG: phosphoribosylanthranilate isomerase, partial [Chloroflexi bacterium]|nr:phosphoribosylanthranilate isomerase [Chloroflexota bacterium]
MIIQIYAFTDPDTAVHAALLGVDQIGFVAGKYGQVYGELSFTKAREIVTALPAGKVSVALTMSAEISEIVRMAKAVQPRIIHISSDMHLLGVEKMSILRARLPAEIQLMKAIAVQDESSITTAEEFARVSDWLLLDSSRAGFPGVGATGLTHDWGISRKIVEAVSIPVILAGGLSDRNVVQAIQTVQPMGVDSNTSTNLIGSRVEKNMDKVAAFVQTVRSWENTTQK